jgi:hypothetical protein
MVSSTFLVVWMLVLRADSPRTVFHDQASCEEVRKAATHGGGWGSCIQVRIPK